MSNSQTAAQFFCIHVAIEAKSVETFQMATVVEDFKLKIISELLKKLEAEMQVMMSAALEAHEAATHVESKADNKYDTRGLEASYLAEGQAKRASDLQRLIHSYQSLEIKKFKKDTGIQTTALVEVQTPLKKSLFFIVPKGGGVVLDVDGKSVQVVTPDSKLGNALMGRKTGDEIEFQVAGKLTEYKILKVT